MQHILGCTRKAITDYDMIQPGDRIAVGVSGGKDSLVLTAALSRLRQFLGIDYTLLAVTIDPCFFGKECDFSAVTTFCEEMDVTHIIKRSDLGRIIFDERQESNPCSLCARMRRGMLHDLCKEHGCNKIALGHHRDDAVETFMMNLFYEGRVASFQPVSYLSRKDLTMIRPLALATERDIINAATRENLPVIKPICPVDGATKRQETKEWLEEMERGDFPGLSKKIFGAMRRGHISGW